AYSEPSLLLYYSGMASRHYATHEFCYTYVHSKELSMSDILMQLQQVLTERQQNDPSSSYVSNLYHKGLNKILEKVGEEATETILAAKDAEQSKELNDVIYETADLWFHSLVMLTHLGGDAQQVLADLERRFGLSGLEEKAARRP